jgi:putative oxidoreductase
MIEQDQLLAFIARLCLVLLFPFSALNKIFDYRSAMAQAAHGWIPLPPSAAAVLLLLGGTLEVVGPLCVSYLGFIVARRRYCSYST